LIDERVATIHVVGDECRMLASTKADFRPSGKPNLSSFACKDSVVRHNWGFDMDDETLCIEHVEVPQSKRVRDGNHLNVSWDRGLLIVESAASSFNDHELGFAISLSVDKGFRPNAECCYT
jgi:hypothetical protein